MAIRRWLVILAPVTGLALCVACVRLAAWSWRHGGDLASNFFHGRCDGGREWSGYYVFASDGQLGFELERILYAAPPAASPRNRWEAEDAVGLRTPTFRPLPFDGPLGFHYECWYTPGPAGSLHVTRLATPLWAGLVPGAMLVLYPLARPFVWRR